MTPDMWYTLAILVVAIILFVTEKLRVDVVALGVVLALTLSGILTESEAVAGFSNTSVLTIAALFIVGGAVLQTGLAAMIGERILHVAGRDETRLMLFVMLASALLSGFMSDTGAVAVLLPAIIALARSARVSTSRLLIPLAYGSLLGGAMTLIGTPPNLIVSNMLREEGLEPFGFFDYTPLGVLLLVAGGAFLWAFGKRVLPDYETEKRYQGMPTPDELIRLHDLSLIRLTVGEGSPLCNKTLAAARLHQDFDVTILEVLRQGTNGFLRRQQALYPAPNMVLVAGDVLLAQGEAQSMERAAAAFQLASQTVSPAEEDLLVNQDWGVVEVLIRPRSALIDRTIREIHFRSAYNLTILEMRRAGTEEVINNNIDLPLRAGDMFLVQGTWNHIKLLKENHRHDFVVMGLPEAQERIGAPYREKAPIAMAIFLVMVVLMVVDVLPLFIVGLGAALAMVLLGCLTMDDAYDAIDWKSLVLIAGMLPMSTALNKVGLVGKAAALLTETAGEVSPLMVLALLFIFTSLFTQVLSNTATAVLVAPIALAAARELDVNPHAFMMGVAVAASMAFASPIASPVNTLVMGAGHYRFSDFMKVGFPLLLVMLVITLVFLPLLFPF